MRFFNTEGPVRPDEHYAVAPLDRVDVGELLGLIRAKRYFVLHAPRQTGKTSALFALRDLLNSGEAGDFRCVDVNVEVGQVARDDTDRGLRAILSRLARRARLLGDDFPHASWQDVLAASGPDDALGELLSDWCLANPVPLVLLIDEIDALVGDTLLSVLRQLRAGYPQRPEAFPASVVLCGVRDVRDYRFESSTGAPIAGGSPFNIAAKSLSAARTAATTSPGASARIWTRRPQTRTPASTATPRERRPSRPARRERSSRSPSPTTTKSSRRGSGSR